MSKQKCPFCGAIMEYTRYRCPSCGADMGYQANVPVGVMSGAAILIENPCEGCGDESTTQSADDYPLCAKCAAAK